MTFPILSSLVLLPIAGAMVLFFMKEDEHDAAPVGSNEADGDVKGRCLSGTVWSEKTEYFSVGDVQINGINSDNVAVGLSQILYLYR